MARKGGSRPHRHKATSAISAADDPVLHAAIAALCWRLAEGATRIADAKAALHRGQNSRAMAHLFELEPLVFEAERILSATFLLAKETASEKARALE